MNPQIQIRSATYADAEILVRFNIAMARETENRVLPLDKITPGVKTILSRTEQGFYLIAEFDGQVAGSLMVTTEWSDWRNGLFWWVQSVYVHPEFRRRGVYRALYEELKTRAEARSDVCGCRLYVERENLGAQETYRRLGMTRTRYEVFEELFGT